MASNKSSLSSLRQRYQQVLRQLQEEDEKEAVMRAKLSAHLEQRQFAQQATGHRKVSSSERQNDEKNNLPPPQSDQKLAFDPETFVDILASETNGNSSKASLAALATFVDRLEEDAKLQHHAESIGGISTFQSLDYTDLNQELGRSVIVSFVGASSVQIPVDDSTTFGDVLQESLRYFSLPSTGALLMDLQNSAWPLGKRVLDCFPNDLTPPFIKLVQRRRAIIPFDTVDIVEKRGDDEIDDSDAERQTLLATSDESGSRTTKRAINPVTGCGYLMVFLQLLQICIFLAIAVLFNPVPRIMLVNRVVEQALFSSEAFAASPVTTNVVSSFSEITSEQEFWMWMQGPLEDRFAYSLATYDYASVCTGQYPFYSGNDVDGHYCTTVNGSDPQSICNQTLTNACQIMRGETTCLSWTSLPVCVSSFGAFAVNDVNLIMGPARLIQHRVQLSKCSSGLLNPTRSFVVSSTHAAAVAKSGGSCNGPLTEDTQTNISKAAPSAAIFTDGSPPDASAWTTCARVRGRESKLQQYFYLNGLGEVPETTVCSLGLNLFPAPSWYTFAIAELADNSWIDEQTRIVEVQFNMYNPTYDLAVTVNVQCSVMVAGGFACEYSIQAMPVFLPVSQFSATQITLGFSWLSSSNWTVFALLLAFLAVNVGCVCCECYFIRKFGWRRYCGCRHFSPEQQAKHEMTRVTATVLSAHCCNVFTWITEGLVFVMLVVKVVFWVNAAQVFMLSESSSVAQLRFSTQWTHTYDFNDIGMYQQLFQLSTVFDAICVWALLLLALKYFHVNVFNAFCMRAMSMACDGLMNISVVLGIVLAAFFSWHYFLFSKTSLALKHPDYSFVEMLTLSELGFDSDAASGFVAPLQLQIYSVLFGLAFATFVALICIPVIGSLIVGVVIKMAELVGVEGYYWLTPPHLLLAKKQKDGEYSRIFASRF